MSKYLDEAKVLKAVHGILARHGIVARDADHADFGHPTITHTRFKTGTSYGEVTITVWKGNRQVQAIRILNENASWEQAKRDLDDHLIQFPQVNGVPQ